MQLTEQNVKEVIVDASMTKAVFVYFYMNAPECEAATKAVRTAISDGNKYVSLVEADVQEQVSQAVAMQLGLQSVPAIVVMKNGRPAAALQGDEIIEKLQETMSKFMPSEADLLISEARELVAEQKFSEAMAKARLAFEKDEKNLDIKAAYAELAIKNKDFVKAHELLDNPGREEQSRQDFKDLVSALDLAEQAADSPELKELEKKYLENPKDQEVVIAYCAALGEAGKKAQALEILFDILKTDLGNADIKKTFLDLLNTMSGDPLQKEYRRKLYTLMY
ncbi:MAG: tetratricopeptide repeat protein [Succinivibrio sp.]